MDEYPTGGEQLLAEFRRDLAGAPPDAVDRMRRGVLTGVARRTSGGSPAVRVRPPAASGRRLVRTAVAAGVVTAVGVAVAVGAATTGTPGHDSAAPAGRGATTAGSTGPTAPGSAGPTGKAGPEPAGRPVNALMLLDRASKAASRDTTPVGNSQFIYTELKSRTTFVSSGADGRTTTRRIDGAGRYWESVDGSKPGWAESTDKLSQPDSSATPANPDPTLGDPTYEYLTTLPTDPDKLLARIRAAVRVTAGSKPHAIVDADQAAFSIIGDLIRRGLLPPKLGAALYQTAAKIPGVKIVQNDVDAAGRHGVGVARQSAALAHFPTSGAADAAPVYKMEWIFDSSTYGYLGAKMESKISKASIALLRRAVVDSVRELPH